MFRKLCILIKSIKINFTQQVHYTVCIDHWYTVFLKQNINMNSEVSPEIYYKCLHVFSRLINQSFSFCADFQIKYIIHYIKMNMYNLHMYVYIIAFQQKLSIIFISASWNHFVMLWHSSFHVKAKGSDTIIHILFIFQLRSSSFVRSFFIQDHHFMYKLISCK